jgi:hypothetical protein
MRYFISPQRVILPPLCLEKAQRFAQQVTPTVGIPGKGYGDTGQGNLQKIQQDHYTSKVGEEAVRQVLIQLGHGVVGPDYQIYFGSYKSWDADLKIDGVDLAVKTQSVELARRFGLSWTFQWSAQRRDPILLSPHAWVCFVQANTHAGDCLVYPPYQIQELTFAEPKLSRLRNTKKVVYAEDLPKLF